MTEREKFEAWFDLYPHEGKSRTSIAWEAWQAARTQPSQVPRLSDEEIEAHAIYWSNQDFALGAHRFVNQFGRAIEAALIAKWSKT